jgi:DNA-binding transcriptional regulator YdaS (Cro superfamily)
MDLQLRTREYLNHYGIKKKYLASLIGIYPSQLSQWLSGEYDLNANQIKIIEDFCSGKSQITEKVGL